MHNKLLSWIEIYNVHVQAPSHCLHAVSANCMHLIYGHSGILRRGARVIYGITALLDAEGDIIVELVLVVAIATLIDASIKS